jgi:hypothetical protein
MRSLGFRAYISVDTEFQSNQFFHIFLSWISSAKDTHARLEALINDQRPYRAA